MIYLDNAATTQIHPKVLDEMMPYLTTEYGNVGGLYELGKNAKDAVDLARERVAQFLHAKPENIIFTSGGSESNSMVFSSILEAQRKCQIPKKLKRVAVAPIEHDSVLKSAEAFCNASTFNENVELDVEPSGRIYASNLSAQLSSLVSVMYENNETGVVNDIYGIAEYCKMFDTPFHTDCTQAAGHLVLDAEAIGCDFLTISSHKIHGPKGVGALYVADGMLPLVYPLIHGGSNQEFGKRGGTENVAGIVGFGKACELQTGNEEKNRKYFAELREAFWKGLRNVLSPEECWLNGSRQHNSGKTISICIPDVDAETLVLALSNDGICISAGSACTSRESEPSHVLKAMGLSDEDALCSIRVSFSEMNSIAEVEGAGKRVGERALEIKREAQRSNLW